MIGKKTIDRARKQCGTAWASHFCTVFFNAASAFYSEVMLPWLQLYITITQPVQAMVTGAISSVLLQNHLSTLFKILKICKSTG